MSACIYNVFFLHRDALSSFIVDYVITESTIRLERNSRDSSLFPPSAAEWQNNIVTGFLMVVCKQKSVCPLPGLFKACNLRCCVCNLMSKPHTCQPLFNVSEALHFQVFGLKAAHSPLNRSTHWCMKRHTSTLNGLAAPHLSKRITQCNPS